MQTIPEYVCGVIPFHLLKRLAEQTSDDVGATAQSTLAQMRELAPGRATTLMHQPAPDAPEGAPPRKRCSVYDANHTTRLPGRLARSDHKLGGDLEATEAYVGSVATYDFFARVFRRASIDGLGLRLVSTVHYGTRFENALWNGRQMVYGDGDGRVFNRFTASLDVIAHELTHGLTQFAAALRGHGQTGALNEHLSDAFGIMVRQYTLGHSARESDWLIGAGIFSPGVNAIAVRSMAAPGTAYNDPLLGRDPQPSHMRDYVETPDDNGGVHINSGILNHGFYRAAQAIGGKTWQVLGPIWYVALTEYLTPEADFAEFTEATVEIAGELCGHGGRLQRIVAEAWSDVGLPVAIGACSGRHSHVPSPGLRARAVAPLERRRRSH